MSRHFELFLALGLCLAIGTIKVNPVGNSDLFWHLKAGELVRTHGLMKHDPLTFTAEQRDWIHHEWAAQVLMSWTYDLGGWTGLRMLKGIVVCVLLLLLYLGMRRDLPGPLGVAAVVISWVCLAPHAVMRPHLFGWLAMSFVYAAVLSVPPPWSWRRWVVLTVGTIVWANLHSSAVILPVLCLVQLVEVLVRRRIAGDVAMQTASARTPGHWARATGLACLAVLAQPAGPWLWIYVVRTPTVNRPWSLEWTSLLQADVLSSHPQIVVVVVMLAVGTVGSLFMARRGDLRFPGSGVAAVTLAMGLYTRRMIFLGFLAAHFVARVIAESRASSVSRWVARAAVFVLALTVVALSLPRSGHILSSKGLADNNLPVTAADFLDRTRLQGNLFNPDYWGGYLSFRLFPHYRTFIDGRWLLVGRQVLEDSVSFQLRRGNVQQLAERYNIAVMIEPLRIHFHTPALDRTLWVLAHVDQRAVVLLRRGAHFAENLHRVCQHYRRHRDDLPHADWPLRLGAPGGAPSPTDVPSAVSMCSGRL